MGINNSIYQSIIENNLENLKTLLKNNVVNINATDKYGWTPLHTAVASNNLNATKYLLDNDANIYAKTMNGKTPLNLLITTNDNHTTASQIECIIKSTIIKKLFAAVRFGNLRIVQSFIAGDVTNLYRKDFNGKDLISIASENQHFEIVRYLKKCKLNAALFEAIKNDNVNKFKDNIEENVDDDDILKNNVQQLGELGNKVTLLEYAIEFNNIEIIEYLVVNKGVDINYFNKFTNATPLHCAVRNGVKKVVELFFNLSKGVDLNLKNAEGFTPLHIAVEHGDFVIVELLIENGADVNARNINGWTPLHRLMNNDDGRNSIDIVDILIENGANINATSNLGWTALHNAIENNNYKLVKYLIEQSIDVNAKTEYGWTALHLAVQNNNLNVIKYLLDIGGVQINVLNDAGMTPFYLAIKYNHLEIIQYLIAMGADIYLKGKTRKSPLELATELKYTQSIELMNEAQLIVKFFMAVKHGSLEQVTECIIDDGVDVDSRNIDGATALQFAYDNDYYEIIQYLLRYGADVNAVDRWMWSALHAATSRYQADVIQLLVENKADVNIKNYKNVTPFFIAVERVIDLIHEKRNPIVSTTFNLLKFLLNNGADINVKDIDGNTPLHLAIINNSLSLTKFLIENNAFIDAKDINDVTPLHLAARYGYLDIVEYLINEGSYINVQNIKGRTAFHEACEKGKLHIVEYFILTNRSNISSSSSSSNSSIPIVNIRDKENWTPLHITAWFGQLHIMKFLIENNADVNLKNVKGRTSIHEAAERGHLHIIKYLIEIININVTATDTYDWTPLHCSSFNGHLHIVKYLLEKGANLTSTNNQLQTVLHLTAQQGHLHVIEYLFEQNISMFFAKDIRSWTALHYASDNGHLHIIEFFTKNRIQINIKNKLGQLPLHLASTKGHLNIVKYFIECCNVDPKSKDNSFYSAAHYAAQYGHLHIIKYLHEMDGGAQIDDKTKLGQTLLHKASEYGHLHIVKYLINIAHYNINLADNNNYWTPLHYSASNGYFNIVKYMINHNVNLNVKSKNGETPLHKSVVKGYLDIVEILILNGAIINIKRNDGISPIQLAVKNNFNEIKQFLVEHGANTKNTDGLIAIDDFPQKIGHTQINNYLINTTNDEPKYHTIAKRSINLLSFTKMFRATTGSNNYYNINNKNQLIADVVSDNRRNDNNYVNEKNYSIQNFTLNNGLVLANIFLNRNYKKFIKHTDYTAKISHEHAQRNAIEIIALFEKLLKDLNDNNNNYSSSNSHPSHELMPINFSELQSTILKLILSENFIKIKSLLYSIVCKNCSILCNDGDHLSMNTTIESKIENILENIFS